MFTVCGLFYGPHSAYASRLLKSWRTLDPTVVAEVRIGLNEVESATQHAVAAFISRCPVPVVTYRAERNVGKYVMMRQMFHQEFLQAPPIPRERLVMWWDDDSWLYPGHRLAWWQAAHDAAQLSTVMGEIWFRDFLGDQQKAIAAQPWYTGQKWFERKRNGKTSQAFRFATGGWWTASMEFLRRWDYPFPDLLHSGGDTVLGELVRQQGGILRDWSEDVLINHGLTAPVTRGRQSNAPRRGLGAQRGTEQLLWRSWTPGQPATPPPVHTYEVLRYAPAQNLPESATDQ